MRKIPFLACCWLIYSLPALAQDESATPLLTTRDSVLLHVEDNQKYILHPVKPKHTLFSISRYYNIGLEELYELNPVLRLEPTLRVGMRIKIPIPNKAIRRYKTEDFVASSYVPLYYVVQSGDNLYQISKRYFSMPVDSLSKRNRLKNNAIKPGQRLQVGWMGLEGIHADWRPVRSFTESDALKGKYSEEKKNGKKESNAQGVCFWAKDSKEKGALYALHRDAAIGSIIQVNNPMSNRTVYAKVIGRIPEGYERNVEVILSPEAARKLAARDPRFFVKTKYYK